MSRHAPSSEWYTIDDPASNPSRRRALLHIPKTYRKDVASPLIIAMHGKDQPPAEFEAHTQLSNPEVNNEAIVVYPEGIEVSPVKQQHLPKYQSHKLTPPAPMDRRPSLAPAVHNRRHSLHQQPNHTSPAHLHHRRTPHLRPRLLQRRRPDGSARSRPSRVCPHRRLRHLFGRVLYRFCAARAAVRALRSRPVAGSAA